MSDSNELVIDRIAGGQNYKAGGMVMDRVTDGISNGGIGNRGIGSVEN